MSTNGKKELYRIPEQGKVAGVCAGLAEYFNLEVWLVRIVVLSAIILTGVFSFALLLYIVAWVLLDKKPPAHGRHAELKTKVWQAGDSPRQAIREISTRFRSLELRLRALEQHVTSDSYSLKREIDNLK
ncbi:phage shock protein C, PspC [Ferrimonas balearica DSM 9799]|uniref:Phage shock protein C, PspC n=1 Tax=Ferrimonas balearica (strain DSM 9799 / CCM 4581 / KCTC 23876 / PAT) TaxID=550540 RepID=E1SPG9_FERBD|nr:envelope stress response membrane protein PspC [Ferrimonas balearica]MBY6017272.1 envelope stress response membrane protein PspC [Halomonas denitrificans]ADN76786.1 phage shock protein C, PspC [Ferrimonas balearica DSM 9799]MBW3140228.1 envelope stress response membrane protein PspC [Ferrimonas balearica]MBW3166237.1 envelope stress response membrane protein PspC [Ferrimonas balearica]MBY5979888.1 envelope stress response membrane protein PspC [Ferrimonas balearica]